jgi:hypothetical protein
MSNVIRQLGLCFTTFVLFPRLRAQCAAWASARAPRSVIVLRVRAGVCTCAVGQTEGRRECVPRQQCKCSALRRGVRVRWCCLRAAVLHNRIGRQTGRRRCVRRRESNEYLFAVAARPTPAPCGEPSRC